MFQTSQHAQACQGRLQRPKQSWELPAAEASLCKPWAAPSWGTGSPPRCSPSPPHVLPSLPLVTLALTHINPISHTAQTSLQNTPRRTQTKEAPREALFVPPVSFQCLEQCGHPRPQEARGQPPPMQPSPLHRRPPSTTSPPNLPCALWAHNCHRKCSMPLASFWRGHGWHCVSLPMTLLRQV